MSFIDKLKDFVGNGLQILGDVVSLVMPKIGDAIWKKGIDIEFGGSSSSYSAKKASAQETIDLQAECNKACKDAEKKTKNAIKETINEAKDLVKYFEKEINKLGLAGLDITIADNYFDSMEDAYLDYIQHEISLDAEAFMKILEIKDDNERKEECKKYIAKVVDKAKMKAINNLKKKLFAALELMTNEMKTYLDDKERSMKERKRQLENLEENKDDDEYVKQVFIEHVIDISYLNCIMKACVG